MDFLRLLGLNPKDIEKAITELKTYGDTLKAIADDIHQIKIMLELITGGENNGDGGQGN
ncbi:MAG TPA: hypothetical protein VIL29_05435 [Pseudothermotoga sp.]